MSAEDGHLDKARVFIAVANKETAHVVLQREPSEQFGFAADFQAEVEWLAASSSNFFHFLAELIDLDGERRRGSCPDS